MSLEADLRTALLPSCPRVYPDIVPDSPVFPLTIYQQVGGEAYDYVEAKVPNRLNARVQVWVWSRSRLECSAVAHAQRIALVEGSMLATTLSAPVSDYDDKLEIYGCRQDFSIGHLP